MSPLLRTVHRTILIALLGAGFARAQTPTPPEPEDLEFKDGVATIPDRETYERLSFQGNAGRDAYLNGIQFVKFILVGAGGDHPKLYFMNTKTRQAHPMFMRDTGVGGGFRGGGRGRGGRGGGRGQGAPERAEPAPGSGTQMRGAIAYRPVVEAPDGTAGAYTFDFQPNDQFSLELLQECYALLVEKAPVLEGKLVYHPLSGDIDRATREKDAWIAAGLPVYLDEQLDKNIAFLAMNEGVAFGRLRKVSLEEIPGQRDVVFYESLPNELPRVAGMITGVRQTPLSHVNLRAIQDRVPNAYVKGAAANPEVQALLGKLVRYSVRADGYSLRAATTAEVDAHFAALRPTEAQSPPLDLSVTEVRPLDAIEFGDAPAFGVKTANLAALRRLGLPDGMVPDGFGVPLQFYHAFMAHNGLDEKLAKALEDPAFRADPVVQKATLGAIRKAIESGEVPGPMAEAFARLHAAFPEGTPIRLRSSTNNEDLPGFSGAGLYASCTHDPDEGDLAASVKQVYASLWSERAFEEREFYRVDHAKTAMGVLVHPSFKREQANGVAVSLDVLYRREGFNYVNAQVGEDMVTNPEARSVPEEVLLSWRGDTATLMQASNRVAAGERVLGDAHLATLRKAMETIHDGFAKHYGKQATDPRFAMEVEFKVTADGKLAIKQARPWIFAAESESK